MTEHPFKPYQDVKVLDAYHKYWTTGKIVLTRDSGAAIDTAQGVRIWASYDRIQDTRSDVEIADAMAQVIDRAVKRGNDLFSPCG